MSNVKKLKSQDVKKVSIIFHMCLKMSNVKKSNTLTMDEVHKKFNLTQ